MIINGWHRNQKECLPNEAIFVGIHTTNEMLTSVKKGSVIGCRDIFTLNEVRKNKQLIGIFTGCISIYLPYYEGIRSETAEYYHSDKHTGVYDIETQIKNVESLINELKTKQLVRTNRLHIAIPCIALGTPVIIEKRHFQQERFSIFDYFRPTFPGYRCIITKDSGLKEKMFDTFRQNFDIIFSH